MTQASVEVADLRKTFGEFVALDAATFRYEGNGAIGYLGPNGAGKTTTLKLLTALLRPSRGVARLNGIDVHARPKEALQDVGTVIETPEPYPTMTVAESLQMVGEFRGLSRAQTNDRIRQFQERLDLPPLDRRTGKLSKGQRQRVVIAGALLSDPAVLLLDEPSSGLDPAERVAVRNVLVELKRDHLILMSSHLLQEVTEICDQVIFINQGKILAQDSVAGIAARFKVTQLDVEFAVPVPSDRWSKLEGLATRVVPLADRRYRLDFDGSDDTRAKLLLRCLEVGPVLSFSLSSLTLEDAYLKLVGPVGGGAK